MKVCPITLTYQKQSLKNNSVRARETEQPTEQAADTVSFKGPKNAAKLGGIGAIGGGLFGGALSLLSEGAALPLISYMGVVGAAIGAVMGAHVDDKRAKM